jgi:hypothetical protein
MRIALQLLQAADLGVLIAQKAEEVSDCAVVHSLRDLAQRSEQRLGGTPE